MIKPILASLLLCSSLVTEENFAVPNFEKALPSEHFFNNEAIQVGRTYGFATNKTLEQLKPLLLKFLGEGWEIQIAPAEFVKNMRSEDNMTFVGLAKLSHPKLKSHEIAVTLIKMPADADEKMKKFAHMLSIVTCDLERVKKIETARLQKEPPVQK